jgi:hypothetical protein
VSLGPAEILVPLLMTMVVLVFVRPRRLPPVGRRVAVRFVAAEGGIPEGSA